MIIVSISWKLGNLIMENNYILDMIGIKTLYNMEENMMVLLSFFYFFRHYSIKIKRICDELD